jgi:hypothetical protein
MILENGLWTNIINREYEKFQHVLHLQGFYLNTERSYQIKSTYLIFSMFLSSTTRSFMNYLAIVAY